MNELRQAVSEGDGQVSSMRLAMFAIVGVSLAVWALACTWPQQVVIVTPPAELVTLVGIALGAKAWQRGRESA